VIAAPSRSRRKCASGPARPRPGWYSRGAVRPRAAAHPGQRWTRRCAVVPRARAGAASRDGGGWPRRRSATRTPARATRSRRSILLNRGPYVSPANAAGRRVLADRARAFRAAGKRPEAGRGPRTIICSRRPICPLSSRRVPPVACGARSPLRELYGRGRSSSSISRGSPPRRAARGRRRGLLAHGLGRAPALNTIACRRRGRLRLPPRGRVRLGPVTDTTVPATSARSGPASRRSTAGSSLDLRAGDSLPATPSRLTGFRSRLRERPAPALISGLTEDGSG